MESPGSHAHAAIRDLVLSYEELSAEERQRADAHLADCEACRTLLASLRRVEERARPLGQLPAFEARDPLDSADRAQADASLAALRARLRLLPADAAGPRNVALAPSPWRRLRQTLFGAGARWDWPRLLVPAAAVAVVALVVFWPRSRVPLAIVANARIAPGHEMRGRTESGWRTGDAFVLDFDLSSRSRPVVFHVDPRRQVSLLYPEDLHGAAAEFPAGRIRLPTPESGIEWHFEGEPGPETFLISATHRADLVLDPVVSKARLLARRSASREQLLRDLTAWLEKRVGPVQAIEVDHLR